MPVSIVANSAANYAHSAIRVRQQQVDASTQRISSGLRVFSAQEDAAAMAVGTSLKIENSVIKSASLNASYGISMLQIADGAMGEISDMLIRMKTLAQQASSGHIDDATRALVDGEFQNMKDEIDRIAKITSFSGVSMLKGSSNFQLQAASSTSADGIGGIHFNQSAVTADAAYRYSYDAATETLTVTKADGATSSSQSMDITALLDKVAGVGQNLGSSQTLDVEFSSLGIRLSLSSSFDRTANILPVAGLSSAAVTAPTAVVGGGTDAVVASPVFMPSAVALDDEAAAALAALGYNAATGTLALPLETDNAALPPSFNLGGVAGLSYGVGGTDGADSANLEGAGPSSVPVYLNYTDGSGSPASVLLGTFSCGAVTAGTVGGTLDVKLGRSFAMGSSAFVPATTNLSQQAVSALAVLGGAYDAVSGVLTLPVETDGAAGTFNLGGVAGISYGALGVAGADSSDLAGAGAGSLGVYLNYTDADGNPAKALLGSFDYSDISAMNSSGGTLTLNVGKGLVAADYIDNSAATELTYKVGAGVESGLDLLYVTIPSATLQSLGLTNLDVTNQMKADAAISAIQSAMTVLNQGRAEVGAQQLRLERVVDNLGVVSENNESARSALLDVDVASEITAFSSNQAMLQAGVAMLSRANTMPDMLLELIRNG